MKNYSPYDLQAVARAKNYRIFSDQLNIWGIRSNSRNDNTFNDVINVFWLNQDDVWALVRFAATTDPGLYWRLHPMHRMGTAILKPGQYVDCWQRGNHHGYPALIQCKPITVYRDANGDNVLDIDSPKIIEHEGMFGINIHRASEKGQSVQVDKWSAGCQVLQNKPNFREEGPLTFNFDWDYFMYLVELSAKKAFSYTLIEENDLITK